MTVRVRRMRSGSGRRSFDLRATAWFFALLALVLCVLGFVVRTAAHTVERRPAWAVVLCLTGLAAASPLWRRRRSVPARAARRAAAALEVGARTAVEEWEDAAPAAPVAAPASPSVPAPASPVVDACGAGVPGGAGPSGGWAPASADAPGTAHGAYDFDRLDADAFEQAVAGLCARDGCLEVEVVGGAGDLGADVVAVVPDGRRLVVQCKRYDTGNRVGSQDLQRFGGTCYTVHEADVAVVVTTGDFTAPAAEYADHCGIVCVDRAALMAWRDGTGPAPWNAAP
ncbi:MULTISPECIES: restriction endonuclease [unclassified Streptomyces]|uniref:restriction endonuclease n=1 Tax=unclassified Streptomyces TaxID=2593676 RepID=UPI0033AE6FCD